MELAQLRANGRDTVDAYAFAAQSSVQSTSVHCLLTFTKAVKMVTPLFFSTFEVTRQAFHRTALAYAIVNLKPIVPGRTCARRLSLPFLTSFPAPLLLRLVYISACGYTNMQTC